MNISAEMLRRGLNSNELSSMGFTEQGLLHLNKYDYSNMVLCVPEICSGSINISEMYRNEQICTFHKKLGYIRICVEKGKSGNTFMWTALHEKISKHYPDNFQDQLNISFLTYLGCTWTVLKSNNF